MPRKPRDLAKQPVFLLRVTLSDIKARERGQPSRLLAVLSEMTLYDLAYTITNAFGFDFDHAFGFYNNLHNPFQSDVRYELFVDLEAEAAEVEEPTDEVAAAIIHAFERLDTEMLEERTRKAIRDVLQDELLQHIPAELQSQARERLPSLLEAMAEDTDADLSDEMVEEDEESVWDKSEALGVREVTVAEAFDRLGKKLLYLFDYGDDWRFIVKLMRTEEIEAHGQYPRVVERVGEAPAQYPELEESDDEEAEAFIAKWHEENSL